MSAVKVHSHQQDIPTCLLPGGTGFTHSNSNSPRTYSDTNFSPTEEYNKTQALFDRSISSIKINEKPENKTFSVRELIVGNGDLDEKIQKSPDQIIITLVVKTIQEINSLIEVLDQKSNPLFPLLQLRIQHIKILNCENLSGANSINQLLTAIAHQLVYFKSLENLIIGDLNIRNSLKIEDKLSNLINLKIGNIKDQSDCELEVRNFRNLKDLSIASISKEARFSLSCKFKHLTNIQIKSLHFNLKRKREELFTRLTIEKIGPSCEVIFLGKLPNFRFLTIKNMDATATFKLLGECPLESLCLENIHGNKFILPAILDKLQTLSIKNAHSNIITQLSSLLNNLNVLTINDFHFQSTSVYGITIFNIEKSYDKLISEFLANINKRKIEHQAPSLLGVPSSTIQSIFYTQDYLATLKTLIDIPLLWQNQTPTSIAALNKIIIVGNLKNLERHDSRLDPNGFGQEIFEALSQEPDPENQNFLRYKSPDGKELPIADIFYRDLDRQIIALGGKPYWNDQNDQNDPLLSSTELDLPTTPEWKKKKIEELRSDCGYIENGDPETNQKAMKILESRLTKMLHEWKERRIQELLEFCGYVEGGNDEQNKKAEQKAYMVSCDCNQNIGFSTFNTSYTSAHTPFILSNKNKFMLFDSTYSLTLNLTKNENNDIFLTTTLQTNNLLKLQEFRSDVIEIQTRNTYPDIPNMVDIKLGIMITNDGEWRRYDNGFVKFMFILEEDDKKINEKLNSNPMKSLKKTTIKAEPKKLSLAYREQWNGKST